jgi:ribosomal protein S18 acetylase RimI-like enzyme
MDVHILTSADGSVLDHVAEDVFDGPVSPALAAEFLADPRHYICVAIEDGLVIGFASAVRYVHPDKPSELWINEVGVSPRFHRRGVGKAVMSRLLAHARAEGCREAWVLTDEDNSAARALYGSAGGAESKAGVMVTFRLAEAAAS